MLPSIWMTAEVQPQPVQPHRASHAQTLLHFHFCWGQQVHHQTDKGLKWEEAKELQDCGKCHHVQGKTKTLRKNCKSTIWYSKQTNICKQITHFASRADVSSPPQPHSHCTWGHAPACLQSSPGHWKQPQNYVNSHICLLTVQCQRTMLLYTFCRGFNSQILNRVVRDGLLLGKGMFVVSFKQSAGFLSCYQVMNLFDWLCWAFLILMLLYTHRTLNFKNKADPFTQLMSSRIRGRE